MHIVILGAGRLGQRVAERLSIEGHSIMLVDTSMKELKEASERMDIQTKCGSGSDPALLEELAQDLPSLVLALTENDCENLVASACVKQFRNLRTIVSLKSPKFFNAHMIDLGRLFHVDHLVVPELLVAEDIASNILSFGTFCKSYFHGNVLVRILQVPEGSVFSGKTLAEIRVMIPDMIVGMIHRQKEVVAQDVSKQLQLVRTQDMCLFPHGRDVIMPEDELLLIGQSETVLEAFSRFGVEIVLPKSVFIVGATVAGIHLARMLIQKGIRVRLADSSSERVARCLEELPDATVQHYESEHIDFLKGQLLDSFDAFVACTEHEESNMLLGLLARDLGANRSIVVLSDDVSAELAEKEGISSVTLPEVVAADRIANFVLQDKVIALDSLYGGKAELIQAKVSVDSPLAGIPLSVLGPKLPPEVLIGVIYTRGRVFIASGNHILSPRDEVIIVCHPKHRALLQKLL